jgi:hypothetical protein
MVKFQNPLEKNVQYITVTYSHLLYRPYGPATPLLGKISVLDEQFGIKY